MILLKYILLYYIMTIHICKITNYQTEQLTHFNNHLKSNTYKLAYEKLLLELNR